MKIKKASKVTGIIHSPGDKSISHRVALISALSNGENIIENFLISDDTLRTLACLEELGVDIELSEKLKIKGRGFKNFQKPNSTLYAGNSGTTIRLLSGILAGQNFNSEITGDDSLRRRPMMRIIKPLRMMGAKIEATGNGTAPLKIYAVENLNSIEYELEIPSAQVKSCIIFAGLHAEGKTKIIEKIQTRDHTERLLGLKVSSENGKKIIEVEPGIKIENKYYLIPGDISSSAFFIVAASIIPNSYVVVKNVSLNPTRTGFIDVLRKMGAVIELENVREVANEQLGDVIVKSGKEINLKNLTLSGDLIPSIIDEIPVLAIAGTVAEGVFEVRDAGDLRNKESDRIKAIVSNLRNMGVDVEEYDDGFSFEGRKKLKGTLIQTFNDHRIAMAFSIAGLIAEGETVIDDPECVKISFPNFYEILKNIQS
ncbi:3-phosphoshikimate 1-carboxyvinyltransferase [Candidatus Kryptonium thompsonii]|uniref:3-phosphoshikimate 1-carboxyvinyltransferase n=1 Tax=Candidatus Kryptonium thompsonii TaxID=1633631 RepID=A0A0P1MJS6_9BACT|nr:3-phosphoshikimate 1-carboxyvinyltransferase [Candidatus Kryptonium thompsoni]CUS78624.1 3-phosphoshikimate 1-carboxyvinyltransferase [Candidatus Kryptonium thompsoni]CUS83531.1 3-phosphoshikimate 1-carboxyvinyltransferase [Candidatus Kryptonium thompsoni]CUS85433.1 3-phosphoshikimate 1-carboxyvinyltransferase [Candidatus Kryptonium thompsoni]CUS87922.1 3-phosphoshikimate 1-carboxyvinyltransferase [Candidatus Kryptonium thompsoni]CUS89305.1 3-phosphoshikimate 1-carboxyvinyltransferase [Cand